MLSDDDELSDARPRPKAEPKAETKAEPSDSEMHPTEAQLSRRRTKDHNVRHKRTTTQYGKSIESNKVCCLNKDCIKQAKATYYRCCSRACMQLLGFGKQPKCNGHIVPPVFHCEVEGCDKQRQSKWGKRFCSFKCAHITLGEDDDEFKSWKQMLKCVACETRNHINMTKHGFCAECLRECGLVYTRICDG